MVRATSIFLGFLLFTAVACGNGTEPRNPNEPESATTGPGPDPGLPPSIPKPPEPEKEVLQTADAAVAEEGIRAAFVEQGLEIEIPVDKLGSEALDGTIEVALLDARSAEVVELVRGNVEFEQEEERAVHRVLLRELPMQWLRGQTAPIVIDWEVRTGSAEPLSGLRSLYTALGPLEVQLRGPTALSRGEGAPLRVIVNHRATSEALDGARVVARLTVADTGEEQLLFEGETDVLGEFVEQVVLPEGATSGQLRVEVSHEEGQAWTTATMTATGEERLHLGSDKTIYKPGQTIELRLLSLAGPERRPVADADAVFEAYDAKGLKVWKRTVRTDEFGAAAASVPTDARVNEGDWRFTANVGGVVQTLSLPVRQYLLPKIGVDVVPEAPYALPGETILAKVDARYLFGEPVVGATVQVSANSPVFNTTYQGTTDENGVFTFEIVAPEAIVTLSSLALSASVVDTAGQQQSGAGELRLSPSPVLVEGLVEQQPTIRGVPNRLVVLVSDPMGQPLVADVELDGLDDEPRTVTTSASGLASVAFTPRDEASVGLVATDGAGRGGANRLAVMPMERPPLVLRADRALYAAGDEARLLVTADRDIERVYVDLFRGLAAVQSVVVPVEEGRGELVIPITREMGGLLLADAFVPTAEGTVVEASTRLLVESDQRLRIALSPSGASFLPGEEAGLEVRVTDLEGNPQVAAIGLSVVNEAAFALGGEPSANLERTFASDSPLLPASVSVLGQTGTDLLNLPPTAERQLLARALFARSAALALAPPMSHFDYSSRATELPQVLTAMQGKTSADGNALVNALRAAFTGTNFSSELWFETVETHAKRLRDPFGQRYRVTVDPVTETLTLEGRGPDEERGTPDDVTALIAAPLPPPPAVAVPGAGAPAMPSAANPSFAGGPDAFAPTDDALAGSDANPPPPGGTPVGAEQPSGVAVRSDFRETVYANPSLVTGADGTATVSFPLAHSISTWRASAEGSTLEGRLGTARTSFRTFQSFFVDFDMPTDLTRGDELELPVVVYNYLAEATDVSVTFEAGSWLELLGPATQEVALGPSEVRAVRFRVRALEAGNHAVTLHGAAGDVADALVRDVFVRPDGEPEDETASGTVDEGGITHALSVPEDAISGGTTLTLTLTPGFAADAQKGVEGMLSEPNGCFEQTTATAWPNTLVVHYLDQVGGLSEEKREEALALLTRGYQRLLTFESPTGGYNWWGDAEPGNRILSAIMLWHLTDLEGLIEIDESVRQRTLAWLLAQQQPDGSFPSGDALHAGNEVLGTSAARTTAFIAWALAHTGLADDAVLRANEWLRANPPENDFYATALLGNALAAASPGDATTQEVLAGLDAAKSVDPEGRITWQSDTPSWTGASGGVAVETTGLVAYGMTKASAFPGSVDGAVKYLLASKESGGNWYSTQATMNALRALSAAARPETADSSGTLGVFVNGELAEEVAITPDQSDVYRSFDLSAHALTGENTVELAYDGTGQVNYLLTRRAYLPALPEPAGPLDLEVTYSATEATVGERLTVNVIATNRDAEGQRDQILVRIGRAPGFEPVIEDLASLVASGLVSRFEVRRGEVVLYLMGLVGGESRALTFRMTPTLAVDALAPPSSISAYYQPDLVEFVPPQRFVVTAL